MSSADSPRRRKTVLIDREFQLRFIWRLGGILFFYLLVFLMVSVVAPVGFTLIGSPPEWAMMETAYRVEVLMNLVLVPMACTFLCLFVHGVIETFRIAGPNYRFKAVFREVGRCRIPRGVKIRQKDYLQGTADEFDKALVSLHDHVRAMKEKCHEASEAVSDGDSRAPVVMQELRDLVNRFELMTAAPACMPLEQEVVEPMSEADAAELQASADAEEPTAVS